MSTFDLDRLTVEERIQLVQEIWDSITPEVEQLPITEAQRNELDRRLLALDAKPTNVILWEEVEARAVARYTKGHSGEFLTSGSSELIYFNHSTHMKN